jgi:hypothetical protein
MDTTISDTLGLIYCLSILQKVSNNLMSLQDIGALSVQSGAGTAFALETRRPERRVDRNDLGARYDYVPHREEMWSHHGTTASRRVSTPCDRKGRVTSTLQIGS